MSENKAALPLFDIDVWDVWPILRKRVGVLLLFFATVVLTTLVFGLMMPKQYQATVVVHLLPSTGQEVKMSEVMTWESKGYFEVTQFYRTQVQIMTSRSIREDVVARYEALAREDGFNETGNAADRLRGMMTVTPVEQSQLINLSVADTDPERAAILANLLAEAYRDRNLGVRHEAARAAKIWLEGKLVEYRKAIEESNLSLLNFKAERHIVDVEEQINSLTSRMSSISRTHAEVQTSRVVAETRVESYDRLLAERRYVELSQVLDNALLRSLGSDYVRAQQDDNELAARYLPDHPERARVIARLKTIESSIESEVKKVVGAERAQYQGLSASEQRLQQELDAIHQELLEFQKAKAEYSELKYEFERNQMFYEKLSERLAEVDLASRTQLNNVYLVDPAIPPKIHFKPNIFVSVIVASFVGLVGGVAFALLREYVDDTITSPADVATYLKVPFIGIVPRLPPGLSPRQADLFTHEEPRSSVAEAIRGVRAMLELNPDGAPPTRILVTSSVAREGKTSTASRIAVSYAQMGRRVVIFDADLRKPRLHKVFGMRNDVGVTNFLLGTASLDDCVVDTQVPNLTAIFSGPIPTHPVELLSSDAVQRFFRELEQRFDIIIVDTPPSVALSDAVTLSRHVDGVIVVVRDNEVSRKVVRRTVQVFQQVQARILGVILNNVDIHRAGANYRYYYAYRDYYYNYTPSAERGDDKGEGAAAK